MLWFRLIRFCTYLVLRLGLYSNWSRLYRFIWERQYTRPSSVARFSFERKAESFLRIQDVGQYLFGKSRLWRADSWRQMFDAIGTPERAHALFEGFIDEPDGLDCDEYMVWCAAVLKKHMTDFGIANLRLLTVTWMTATGRVSGHNVCFIEWLDGTFGYMDYGNPNGPWPRAQDVVDAVLARYSVEPNAKPSTRIVWALTDPTTLANLETHWG